MASMPAPHPSYLRPSISPTTASALHTLASAAASGSLATVRSLITSNTSNHVSLPRSDYLTHGLVAAINTNQPEIARYLLDNGASIADRSVTVAAGTCKSLEIFKALAERGWDVNALGINGQPVLATVLPDETLVTWLLSHGADPNLGTPGATLNAAACSSTLAVFELLLQHGADVSHCTPLHAAAGASEDAGRIPMLTYLIDELGFDVDADDGMKGMRSLGTPLHYAIRVGGVEKVRFFRDKGASLERRNRMGSTALEEAEKTAYGEVIQVLKGAE